MTHEPHPAPAGPETPSTPTTSVEAPVATVAIVVRTKDRPVFLRRALDDILDQTFEDYVVVVVNDVGEAAPVDAVVDAVAHRAKGRIHVVHRTSSTGMESASNVGIAATSSTYLSIHDDDDTWHPTFLEAAVAYLDRGPEPAVGVRTEVVFERLDEQLSVDRRLPLAPNRHEITLYQTLQRNYAPPISLLYRRELHDELGPYDEDLPVLGDWDFNLRILQRHPMGFVDGEPLAFWHQREGVEGSQGNSVIAGRSQHEHYDLVVRDRYLRRSLAGEPNVGLLLHMARLLEDDRLADDVRERSAHDVYSQIVVQLAELNGSLLSQTNRYSAQLDRLTSQVEELTAVVQGRTETRARSLALRVRERLRGGVDG